MCINLQQCQDFVLSKCLHYYFLVVDKCFISQLCVILYVRTVEPALILTCVTVQQSGQETRVKHVMKLILIYYEKWGNSEPIHGIFVMNAIYIDPVFSFTRHSHHVCNVVLSKKSSLLVGG